MTFCLHRMLVGGSAVPARPSQAYDETGAPHGLLAALQRAATPAREVVLTFANLGYADFVLNGFTKAAVPNTLVIALDADAHAAFEAAGLHSYFDAHLPPIAVSSADHLSAAFMDIMKLRLLLLAEVRTPPTGPPAARRRGRRGRVA